MGKVVVVTGGGSGLGRAAARRLSAAGHTLVVIGRTLSKVEAVAQALGAPAAALACDVGSPDSVRTAFAALGERFGRIDVLINNAAVFEPFLVRDATDAQIRAALDTNLAGPIYCSRAAIPLMPRGGHIINVSSEVVGLPYAMFSLYQASKAGLERFTATLHDELAEDGLRVTLLRAGQMYDEDATFDIDPDVRRRFVEENVKRGVDLRARPLSHFNSVVGLFETLVALPDDVNVPIIGVEGWRA